MSTELNVATIEVDSIEGGRYVATLFDGSQFVDDAGGETPTEAVTNLLNKGYLE